MQNVVPDNLRDASAEQLLYLALACDSGGDLVTNGLVTVLTDLDVVYEALAAEGDGWAASAIHQVQTRLRVLHELARRQADKDDRTVVAFERCEQRRISREPSGRS